MDVSRCRPTKLDRKSLAEVASKSLSAVPRPFLRWAGAKRWLLPHLVPLLPEKLHRYHEPFLGGASLFFLLRPKHAVLGDTSAELIATYRAVRDNSSSVWRHISRLTPDKETFYRIRGARGHTRYQRAAEFIYLNKTCWNGLYRVNSAGHFNVPYGSPSENTVIADRPNLTACEAALGAPHVELRVGDFARTLENAERKDLVFLDPPYVTGHQNNGFVDYNETLFRWADQQRLAETAETLRCRGCHVIVTNATNDAVTALYPNFCKIEVSRHSTIAASKKFRTRTTETVLLGFRPS